MRELHRDCAAPVEEAPVLDSPLVVVAEDDGDMRRLVAASLSRAGFEVMQAPDGLVLTRLLRRLALRGRRPAAVLTDIHMPGRDGLEVLVELESFMPGVPVLMMTASGDDATHRQAKRLGAVAIFDKPLDLPAVTRSLWVLARHQLP